MIAVTLVLAMFPWVGICADLHASVRATDLSQVSARPATTEDRQAIDFETLPLLDVTLQWPKSRFTVGYGPRFLRADAFGSEKSTFILHVGRASYFYGTDRTTFTLAWASTFGNSTNAALTTAPTAATATTQSDLPPPSFTSHNLFAGYAYTTVRSRYTLTQTASYGRQSLAALALASSPGTTPNPTGGTTLPIGSTPQGIGVYSLRDVTLASEATTGGYSYAWTRRWRSTFTASYGINGGFHRSDQEIVPQQRSATGATAAEHALTRRDGLITTLSVTETEVERGARYAELQHWIGIVSEAWKRTWNPDLNTSLILGVAVVNSPKDQNRLRNDSMAEQRSTSVGPSAGASINDVILREGDFTLTSLTVADISPGVNGANGNLQWRVSGASTLQLTASHSLLSARVEAVQTLPPDDPNSARIVAVQFVASQEFSKAVGLAARYRLIWQDFPQSAAQRVGVTAPVIWIASLSLTLAAPEIVL